MGGSSYDRDVYSDSSSSSWGSSSSFGASSYSASRFTSSSLDSSLKPNGKILGQISKGTELSCNIEDGWCRTTYAGRIVFVSLKVLEKRTSAGETKSPAPVRNNAEPPVNREAGLVRAVEN